MKDWNNAKNSNTIQSYDFFLNKYKSGKYTYSANRSLSKLMREEQERESLRKKDWENAKTINSIKSYEDFINKHIKGKYIPTAIKNLNLLKTEEKSNLEFNNTQEEKNNSSTSMLYDILYFAWDIILIIFYAFVIYLIFLLIGGLFIDTFSDTTLHIIGIIIAFVYLIWKIIDEFFF